MTTIQEALRKTIADSFSLEELALLCADIGIDPDNVSGRDKGKEVYLGEIINYAQRRGLLDALVRQVKVKRPHLQLDLFSLDAGSISGWLYGEAHLEIDRKVFQEVRNRLRECLQFVRDHDYLRPFSSKKILPIPSFLTFCQEPESEFIDSGLDELCISLRDEVYAFNKLIKKYMSKVEAKGWSISFLRHVDLDSDEFMDGLFDEGMEGSDIDWLINFLEKDRMKFYLGNVVRQRTEYEHFRSDALESLRNSSKRLWATYYAFVQEGRKQLGVP